MVTKDPQTDAGRRYLKRKDSIERTQRSLSGGRVFDLDTKTRIKKYVKRQKGFVLRSFQDLSEEKLLGVLGDLLDEVSSEEIVTRAQKAIENIQHPKELKLFEALIGLNDILSIEYLEEGLIRSSAVGMIDVAEGLSFGTGFLVGHDILMTNHHVLPNEKLARNSIFSLNYEYNKFGAPKRKVECQLEPNRFYYSHKDYDFALCAIRPLPEEELRDLSDFGFLPMLQGTGKIQLGDPVTIIQHPKGRRKKIAIHDAKLVYLRDRVEHSQFCNYTADTQSGSSGSPVFNSKWEIIAVHHAGIPKRNEHGEFLDEKSNVITPAVDPARYDKDPRVVYVANEGVRTSHIVKQLRKAKMQNEKMELIKDRLLKLWDSTDLPVT